jgi:hypothetical protein
MGYASMSDLNLAPIKINGKTYLPEIGVVESTFLGIEDHGLLTFILQMSFGGSGQGAGMYSLDGYKKDNKEKRVGSPSMGPLVRQILEVCGVDQWEKVKGRKIVVLRETPYDKILGIMNLPPGESHYLIFQELFDEYG